MFTTLVVCFCHALSMSVAVRVASVHWRYDANIGCGVTLTESAFLHWTQLLICWQLDPLFADSMLFFFAGFAQLYCKSTTWADIFAFLHTDVFDCMLVTCENGGTCSDASGAPVCTCPSEFLGDRCETQRSKTLCLNYMILTRSSTATTVVHSQTSRALVTHDIPVLLVMMHVCVLCWRMIVACIAIMSLFVIASRFIGSA